MFDILVLLVLAVSGIVGIARGAVRELVAVLAFLAAVMLAIVTAKYTAPFALSMIQTEWLARTLAMLVVFVLAYVALRLLGAGLAKGVHQTPLGPLDRLIGLGFGLIRALALLGVFNIVFSAAVPMADTPDWIAGARLYPLTRLSADALMTLRPHGDAVVKKVGPAIKEAVTGSGNSPADESRDKSGK